MNEVFYGTENSLLIEIVSLLRKIYKRDAHFKAVFEIKTLAVLFPPYPREMKTNTRNLNLLPIWRLFVSMKMMQPGHSHTRSIARAWLKAGVNVKAVLTWFNSVLLPISRPRFKQR